LVVTVAVVFVFALRFLRGLERPFVQLERCRDPVVRGGGEEACGSIGKKGDRERERKRREVEVEKRTRSRSK